MLAFIKKIFFTTMNLFAYSLLNVNLLKRILMNNQEWKIRPEIVDFNSNEPTLFPFSIKTSKCSGSCNNINNPFVKLCVPDVVKNINLKLIKN